MTVRHAVASHEDDQRFTADIAQDVGNGVVDGDENVADRVARRSDRNRVPTRTPLIVQVPALVADAVALGEDLGEEVPLAAAEVMPGEHRLFPNAVDEPAREVDEFRGRAVADIAARCQGMDAETRLHFPLQRWRPGPEAVVSIVRAPLDHLNAVEVL